jgi:hypothetical protein
MRLLLVYRKLGADARALVEELRGQSDVTLVLAADARTLPPEAEQHLKAHPGCSVALVSMHKHAAREVRDLGGAIGPSVATIAGAKATLIAWAMPSAPKVRALLLPRRAFVLAAAQEPKLIIAPSALDSADALGELRHPFVNDAAEALRELAHSDGRVGKPIEQFFRERGGLLFAPNSADIWVSVTVKDERVHPGFVTEWHLKQGDRTDRELAARIYFCQFDSCWGHRVLVLYCGPHPESELSASIILPKPE